MSLKKKIALTVCALLFLATLNEFAGESIRNMLFGTSSAPQKFFWEVGQKISDFFEGFLRASALKTENKELAKQNLALLKERIDLDGLKEENEALRKMLDLGLQKNLHLIMAELQGKEQERDFILLDRGRDDGLLPEMTVISEEGVLIGKIVNVYKDFAKAQMISDRDFGFAVEIQTDKEPVLGKAQGRGNGELAVGFLPLEAEFKEGSLVYTSASLDNIFPKGLLIGKVKEANKSSLEPFQEVIVETFFKNDLPMILFIITSVK